MTAGERQQATILDGRILELIRSSAESWSVDETELNGLALDIFAYQYAYLPAYRRYATARGATPARLSDWRQIPAVPAPIFKRTRYAAFPRDATRRVFRSSGTTGQRRAELVLDTLVLYDAALVPPIERFLLPDGARLPWIALLPDPARVTDSSLAYMVGRAAGSLATGVRFLLEDGAPAPERIAATLAEIAGRGEPICLLGTAFAFVHLLDTLRAEGTVLPLAAGSRIMETGGFKGRSRTVERAELYAELCAHFDLPPRAVVGEYGMCEMSSQFYDDSLRRGVDDPAAPRIKHPPPWVRTRVVDPVTLEPVADGETGILIHLDLTGRGTALQLMTEDLGRRSGDGFELAGRQPGAEPRGCSLAYEEILRLAAER